MELRYKSALKKLATVLYWLVREEFVYVLIWLQDLWESGIVYQAGLCVSLGDNIVLYTEQASCRIVYWWFVKKYLVKPTHPMFQFIRELNQTEVWHFTI